MCGLNPAVCNCICPSGNINCAGAEIGIYYADATNAARGFYEIDTEGLNITVEMDVKYQNVDITTDFVQTNWWVTSFTPRIQNPNINDLVVNFKVKFADSNTNKTLMRSFYGEYFDKPRKGLSFAPTANCEKTGGHSSHFCGNHPAVCICTCVGCENPCQYYTDFGDKADKSHLNENGYQFYVDFVKEENIS